MAVESKPVPPATPSAPDQGAADGRGGRARRLMMRTLTLRESSIVVVTLVTFAYFALSNSSSYLTYGNWKALLPYFTYLAIMAVGEVFVMTLGEIDLSIGGMYLVAPILFWKLNTAGIPLVLSLILSLLIVAVFGAITGAFVAYVGIASFVASLAMLFFLEGLSLILTHSTQVTTPGTAITHVTSFANIFGAGTYSEFIWAIGLVVVFQVVLSFTRWGIYTVATGGNKLGAAETGINVRLILIRNFILSGSIAGFAGLLEAIRTSSITPDPSGATSIQLLAIAAVIIGGTVMTGGEGTVVGALIGALFLGVLQDGLVVRGVSANYEYLYIGIAIIIAMALNVLVRRLRLGTGRA